MATWVFTWSNWFSISSTICFSIRSGSSAFSTRSFKLARSNVLTRSSNDIVSSFSFVADPVSFGRQGFRRIALLLGRSR